MRKFVGVIVIAALAFFVGVAFGPHLRVGFWGESNEGICPLDSASGSMGTGMNYFDSGSSKEIDEIEGRLRKVHYVIEIVTPDFYFLNAPNDDIGINEMTFVEFVERLSRLGNYGGGLVRITSTVGFKTGTINQRCFIDGKFVGTQYFASYDYRFAAGDPVISSTFEWSNDMKNGTAKFFDRYTGKIYQTIDYLDGEFDGFRRKYAQDGTVIQEVEFRKGVRDGYTRIFNRNGKLICEGICKNDLEYTGEFIELPEHFEDIAWFYERLEENGVEDVLIRVYEKGELIEKVTRNVRNL